MQVWVPMIFIDMRNFPGNSEGMPPGPAGDVALFNSRRGYMSLAAIGFPINQWLSDALLVGSISNSIACVLYTVHSSSYIVATSFMP